MVSIIIPNFNGARLLPLCLDSLRAQTFRDFEILIVDNNSSDNSCDLLEEHYPEVMLIKLDYNSGFAAAVNRGLEKARGQYVALFNNDAAADPQWLETLLEAMNTPEHRIGICASKILFYFRRDTIDSAGVFIYDDGIACNRGNQEKDRGQYDRREFIFGACGAAALYRRDLLEELKINGQVFDEDFFAYHEDADINMRSQLLGYECLYVPEALVYHVGSATSTRLRFRNGEHQVDSEIEMAEMNESRSADCMVYYYSSNFWNIIIKDMPADYFWRKLWKTCLFASLAAFGALIKKRLLIFMKGHWRILKLVPAMLGKRRQIQKQIRADRTYLYSLFTTRTLRDYGAMIGRALSGQLKAATALPSRRRCGKKSKPERAEAKNAE